jgi:hypothetical protein
MPFELELEDGCFRTAGRFNAYVPLCGRDDEERALWYSSAAPIRTQSDLTLRDIRIQLRRRRLRMQIDRATDPLPTQHTCRARDRFALGGVQAHSHSGVIRHIYGRRRCRVRGGGVPRKEIGSGNGVKLDCRNASRAAIYERVNHVSWYHHSEAGRHLLDVIAERRFGSAGEPNVDLLASVVMSGAGPAVAPLSNSANDAEPVAPTMVYKWRPPRSFTGTDRMSRIATWSWGGKNTVSCACAAAAAINAKQMQPETLQAAIRICSPAVERRQISVSILLGVKDRCGGAVFLRACLLAAPGIDAYGDAGPFDPAPDGATEDGPD